MKVKHCDMLDFMHTFFWSILVVNCTLFNTAVFISPLHDSVCHTADTVYLPTSTSTWAKSNYCYLLLSVTSYQRLKKVLNIELGV